MCDALLFIDKGQVVHHGSAASLKRGLDHGGVVVSVLVAEDPERLRQWALMSPGVEILEGLKDGLRLRFASAEPAALAERVRAMVSAGLPVVEFRREERRLEDAFVDALLRLAGPPSAEEPSLRPSWPRARPRTAATA